MLLLTPFWRSDARLRWLYIVIGGLSSPIIVVVAGLLAVRAVFERKPSEYCAVPVSLIQFVTIHANVPLNTMKFGLGLFTLTIQGFFGLFLFQRLAPYRHVSGLWSSFLFFIAWSCRARLNGYFFLLVLADTGICALTLFRIPVDAIHPFFAGPRYFFIRSSF